MGVDLPDPGSNVAEGTVESFISRIDEAFAEPPGGF
jgi:hypothetical protein